MKWVILFIMSLCLLVHSRPLKLIGSTIQDDKNSRGTESREIENVIPSLSTDDLSNDAREIVNEKSTTDTQPTVSQSPPSSSPSTNPFVSLLEPLVKRIQFSPQQFWTDRLIQLKETLGNLGIAVPNNFRFNITNGRQLGSNGLFHVAGFNDGFYTDRLEPAGFFSGNGWFANKGGLLGGPGAIFSTGPILTDYPTPYKKK
ncbi:uncharacterized protein [Fopius arisanus]|uniref:Uncharacterized protein isoform X1 n=2 Tax=Fopius arisanus TaxID=64838 RepID=A0A9R1U2Y9_9HYME|nr:PREDICTED: uncharacterized protein LOC105268505 isoform X1 [Fopius arisanus]